MTDNVTPAEFPIEKPFSKKKSVPVSDDLKQRCKERLVQCKKQLGFPASMPTISFDLKGTTAGEAHHGINHVRLNAGLLNKYPEHFVHHVVGHELAHLAAKERHADKKIAGHGFEWRHEMSKLGLPAYQYHVYDISPAPASPLRAQKHPRFLPETIRVQCPCSVATLRGKRLIDWQEGLVLCCPKCRKAFTLLAQ
jgi:predicted SprT family Zn-dependent metalloprotease